MKSEYGTFAMVTATRVICISNAAFNCNVYLEEARLSMNLFSGKSINACKHFLAGISNEMVDQKVAVETQAQAQPATVPKKMKIQKPKKAKKEDQVKIIMDESTADDQEDKK